MRDEMRFKGIRVANVDIRIDPTEFFQINAYRRVAAGKKEQVATAVCQWGDTDRAEVVWRIYKGETTVGTEPHLITDDFDVCLSVMRSSFGSDVELTGLVEFRL
jgi:hypothetical protein